MMEEINISINKKILKTLLNNETVSLYFFHKKYAMDLAELSSAVEYLIDKKFIVKKGNDVTISKEGKMELLINKRLYIMNANKIWNQIPEGMLFNKLKNGIKIKID